MAKTKIGERTKSQKSGDAEGSDAEDSDADGYAKSHKTEESHDFEDSWGGSERQLLI